MPEITCRRHPDARLAKISRISSSSVYSYVLDGTFFCLSFLTISLINEILVCVPPHRAGPPALHLQQSLLTEANSQGLGH